MWDWQTAVSLVIVASAAVGLCRILLLKAPGPCGGCPSAGKSCGKQPDELISLQMSPDSRSSH
ncbi:MAG: hypothetical protein KDA78_00200 [Planctomycetaceae bacterium]|nr:hypothetical protein [Planctomycetaceae bacterium]